MSVIGRIRSRRRSPPVPRFAVDGRLTVAVDPEGVAAVTGEVDIATAPALREGLEPLIGARPLLVDLAGVSFMDSSGLAVILDLDRQAAAQGGRLALVAPSHAVALLFEVTGLGEQLQIFPSREAARAG